MSATSLDKIQLPLILSHHWNKNSRIKRQKNEGLMDFDVLNSFLPLKKPLFQNNEEVFEDYLVSETVSPILNRFFVLKQSIFFMGESFNRFANEYPSSQKQIAS